MFLRGKSIGSVQAADILALLSDGVLEDLVLEYKQSAPDLTTPQAKEEFAADVAAFANKSGGVIIYGVEEQRTEKGLPTSAPKAISGVKVSATFDSLRQQMESVLQSLVSPPILGVTILNREVASSTVVVLGIPRSPFRPHMVGRGARGHFVTRRNGFKDNMDIAEIRQAFLEADSWLKEAEEFRSARINGQSEDRMRVYGPSERCCYLHMVPLGRDRNKVDLAAAIRPLQRFLPYGSHCHPTYNVEGISMYQRMMPLGGEIVSCFRNGAIEWEFPTPILNDTDVNSNQVVEAVDGINLHARVMKLFEAYEGLATTLAVSPPFMVLMSLFGVGGLYCSGNPNLFRHFVEAVQIGKRFDRSPILIPGVYLEALGEVSRFSESELLETLWQSAGWENNPFADRRDDIKGQAG